VDKPLPEDFDPYEEAPVNYGRQDSGGTSKLVFWLLGGLMTINVSISVAFFTWTAKSIVDMQTDIAVIKCQLSPHCPKVFSHGSK